MAIIGIGIDLVDIERFRTSLARTPSLRTRLFTDIELAYVAPKSDPVPSLAARFAAREAVMKSLGLGLGAFGFHDVWVERAESGEPSLAITGRASELAAAAGVQVLASQPDALRLDGGCLRRRRVTRRCPHAAIGTVRVHAAIMAPMIEEYTAAWNELTAPGGPFAMTEIEVRGVPMRVFDSAPPSMRFVWEMAAGYGDKDYVVFEDERFTYAESDAIIKALATTSRRRSRRAATATASRSRCATTPSGCSRTGRSCRSARRASG